MAHAVLIADVRPARLVACARTQKAAAPSAATPPHRATQLAPLLLLAAADALAPLVAALTNSHCGSAATNGASGWAATSQCSATPSGSSASAGPPPTKASAISVESATCVAARPPARVRLPSLGGVQSIISSAEATAAAPIPSSTRTDTRYDADVPLRRTASATARGMLAAVTPAARDAAYTSQLLPPLLSAAAEETQIERVRTPLLAS